MGDMGHGLSYLMGISFPVLHYLWSLALSQKESKKVIVYLLAIKNPHSSFYAANE